MSIKTIMIAAMSMPIAVFAGETAYWDPNGSGPWSEGARWQEKEAPAKNAYIKNADAYATDGDFTFMQGLERIRLQGASASLDLRFDSDQEGNFNTLMIDNAGSTTKATVYKSGNGTFYQYGGYGILFSNYYVTNGTLRLGIVETKATNMVYGAFAPGQLLFYKNANLDTKGLVGDGSISSGYNRQVVLWGDCFHDWADMSPFVYSGTLGANMNLTVMAGRHHFTGSTAEALAIQLYGGELGVRTLGMAGVSGSVGSGQQLNFLGDGTLLYLGTGEETDKVLRFDASCETAIVDAGVTGGVRFTASWNGDAAQDRTIVLTGSNTLACVIAADITAADERCTTFVKRGSGTWDLSDVARAKITGPVVVEEGVLKVATLAPTNQACAIGLSTSLGANAAIVLGAEDATGTLAYTGSAYSRAEGRTISLAGDGRLTSSATTGAVNYFGVTAAYAQGAKLVLDGTGTHDGVNDIGGGADSVRLEKTGAGTWSVGGSISVEKTDVKQGRLIVNNLATRYNYYRFTITELWGGKRMQIREFGLFDADGNQVNAGLAENVSVGRPYDLTDGSVQFGESFTPRTASDALYMLVDGAGNTFLDGSRSSNPTKGDSDTWYVFTMKLPDGAQPVRFYDIKASMGYNASKSSADGANWQDNHMCSFEARGWRVEASTDGRQWDLLDEKYHDDATVAPIHGAARWYHSDDASFNPSNPGWSIPEKPTARTVSLGAVSVTGNAELLADAPVEISHLVADAASGGFLSNVTFAANGTLDVVNATKETSELPLRFSEGTDLRPVMNWVLRIDGIPSNKRKISVANGRLILARQGMIITFR